MPLLNQDRLINKKFHKIKFKLGEDIDGGCEGKNV
jgi:hypothetical protein